LYISGPASGTAIAISRDIMKRLFVVLAVMLVASNGFAKSANRPASKAAKKKIPYRSRAHVTTIDVAGPAEPESPWPEVTKKGHL
jgi:hypothetical protein